MGLCKCPKKSVTTMFCYEHRVNVCQHCMVVSHKSCVVQSYLSWLRDTDYDPICAFCGNELVKMECVRLLCYHIFHWVCFQKYCDEMPSTTAPAGCKCPICLSGVIPDAHLVSPVADELRKKLRKTIWGRNIEPTSEKSVENIGWKSIETFDSRRKTTIPAAFKKNSKSDASEKFARKIASPYLCTIDEDSEVQKYARKRYTLISWRGLNCRQRPLNRVTLILLLFCLLWAAFVFLLPANQEAL